MKSYIGTKVLNAEPMTRGAYNSYRGWDLPDNEDGSDAGYMVRYKDGYISWTPARQFEEAYRETDLGLTFGMAIEAMKLGFRVSRSGWNGHGMCVYMVPAASYPVQTGAAKEVFGAGAMVPYDAYFALVNSRNTVSTWVPSINDCLSEDWRIL